MVLRQTGLNTRISGSLADQVWERLRFAIVHGKMQPGERLVELELAEQMGTSQGPVREALQRLERDGLVERRARSGTFVTSISIDEMVELFSVRSVVEAFAMRRTMQQITPAQLDELQALVEAMRLAGQQDDVALLVENDMEFHRRICEWSNSATLLQVWTPLYTQIQRFVARTHKRYFPDLVEVADTHQPLVDVLRGQDSEHAAQLMQEHIMLIWSRIDPEESSHSG